MATDPSSPTTPPLSRGKRLLFTAIMAALPVLLLGASELVLWLVDYGGNLDLFVQAETPEGPRYVLNPRFTRRYFFYKGVTPPNPHTQSFPVTKDERTYRVFCLGGSTTQGTPYPPNGAFPAFLKYVLETLHPDKRIEVINCGVTAIASYSVVDMAEEILERYQPDMLVVYTGHNEFYGVFGLGSQLSLFRSRSLVRWFLKLQQFRLFRLIREVAVELGNLSLRRDRPQPIGTLMGAVIRDARILYGDEVFRRTERYYRQNLQELVQAAQVHRTDIILCTLASNLRDLPPFASAHGGALSAEDSLRCEELLNAARQALEAGRVEAALPPLQEAFRLDSTYAETRYLLGKYYDARQEYREAYRHYRWARDYDVIRFRAPSSFNRIIREVAGEYGALVADVAKAFADASPGGIMGNNLFTEHVHPNHRGYFLIGKTVARTMAEQGMLSPRWDWGRDLPDSSYLAMAHLSPLALELANAGIFRLTSYWPFRTAGQRRTYHRVGDARTEALALHYIRSPKISPVQLHIQLGNEYLSKGKIEKALAEFEAAAAREPQHCRANLYAGQVYGRKVVALLQGHEDPRRALRVFQRAEAYLQKAALYCPKDPEVHLNLGKLYSLMPGKKEKARAEFRRVLELDPRNNEARRGLAALEKPSGR